MYKVSQPIEYDSQHGAWEFTMPKAYKGIPSQAGLKIVIDPGYPTGYNGNLWSEEENGLSEPTITIKGYDNVSGWVSSAKFSIPQLLKALINLMPEGTVDTKTMTLALNDLTQKEKENEG